MIKYIIQLIIVFYAVRLGMRFLDGLFTTKPANGSRPSNNWTGKTTTERPKQKTQEDYIDYEEIK